MFSLYKIDKAVETVINGGLVVDEETGEILFDAETFEALEGARNDKLEAVACFIKGTEAEAAAIKSEESALAERRKVLERKAERMRGYLADSMERYGDTKLETPRVSVSFRRSATVEVYDLESLPREFVKVKTTAAADKVAIKKAIKEGQEVQGAELVERMNLQLK